MSPEDRVRPLSAPGEGEPGEVERLRRRLERERAARREAETISERITRELYDKQQGLIMLEHVAKAANDATSVEEALLAALEAIHAQRSWPIGHAWLLDDEGMLCSTGLWSGEAKHHEAFRAASDGLRFARGEGLPGRVLALGSPVWMEHEGELSELPRGATITATGLRSAVGFPLLAGHEVVGVLEFYAHRVQALDEGALAVMAQVGTQLGRVVERERAADALRHQAMHDSLTGLPNRLLILEHLDRGLSRQRRRAHEQAAVFFLDLDGFKAVNDSLGHAAGDRVLRDVAARLSAIIRPHDTLGRLGGDEFVIVCEGLTDELPVARIAERLGAALHEPFEVDGEQFLVTASIGIALAEGQETPEQLIEHADAAMYRSKELGRARYEVFSPHLRQRLSIRVELERALRHAVERDELRLHYQPEVDLRSGEVVGVEGLLRWWRSGELVLPGDFIPLAEETGLIVPVGAWALREAIRQSREWERDPAITQTPWTSVNLSVRQLSDPGLMDTVAGALRDGSGTWAKLYLEVTESVILEDAEAGLTVLTALKDLGTEIAIDDFGTGYASLSYLRRFPASVLKIDRSFIATIAEDERTFAIVSAIVDMAHALGLAAVAEGIETAEQLAAICALGCDIGQGYFFSRPCPPDELLPTLGQPAPFAGVLPETPPAC